ncbi:MAG: hypothetical protein K0Q94_5197 [Paenibacillus sp.]|nr:hypothetical protein [Paenibacillus sp.]
MLTTIKTLMAIRMSSSANRLLYYARKLPVLGDRIPDSFFASRKAKQAVTVFALLLVVLWGFVSKLGYLGLLVYLPVVWINGPLPADERLRLFLHVFLLLSFVVAGVTSASVLEPKREKYVAVKLMRMAPAAYMKATMSYRYVTFFLYYVPALLIFAVPLGLSVPQTLGLAISVTMWRVLCEYAHLLLFEKTRTVLIKHNPIVWTTIILGYAAAYAPLLLQWTPWSGLPLLAWPLVATIAAAGFYAAVKLSRYIGYRPAVDAATNRDDPLLNLGQLMADAQKNSVQTKETDFVLTPEQADKYGGKEGYTYLNALFFARHRSLIIQPVQKRLLYIAVAAVAGSILAASGDGPSAAFFGAGLGAALPFLVLLLNFLSIGDRACRALFYHCDISLLRYSYYRKAAYDHFRIRLYRIAGLNAAIAAALGAALSLIAFVSGGASGLDLILMWLCVLALALFFSVHYLFMYYIFQPYTTELHAKNPFYHLINLIVSFACGISIIAKAPPLPFASVILSITLLYAAIALLLVRRYGHRTFRVK